MGKDIRDAAVVHRMKTYLIGIPASGGSDSIMQKWKERVAVYITGGQIEAEKEIARLFPFIVSWELSENEVEFTVFEDPTPDVVDPLGILTIASNLGFNPPISNQELHRWRMEGTGAGGNVKLTIFLSDKKVTWSPEGVL